MSEIYRDLGGGPTVEPHRECVSGRRHRYDSTSGYCTACGRRDDGRVVDGTPAARAARGLGAAQRNESE